MSSHLIFHGIDAAARANLEKYWNHKKLPRLHRLLVAYPPEQRDLWLTVHHEPRGPAGDGYDARAVLHLPTGTLVAEAQEKDAEVVLDLVADLLASKIRRNEERVRKDRIYHRKAHRRANLGAVGPVLQSDVDRSRRDDFNRLLHPLLGFLRGQARRELKILELEGVLHPREVTVDDLLDDVLVKAWEQWSKRPRNVPLDLWLTDLLHQRLKEVAQQEPRPHESLEIPAGQAPPGEIPPLEARQEQEEKEWWDEIDLFEQPLQVEDLLPDWQAPEPWQELEAQEQQERLWSLLQKLPERQRQTFLLHALEDHDPAEIAALQNRAESEVKADIEAARQTLRKGIEESLAQAASLAR